MKKILVLLIAAASLMWSNISKAQQLTPPQQTEVNKLFKTKKVVYFKFHARSLQEIPQFAKILSVDKSKGTEISAHADKAQFTNFIRMNLKYTVIAGTGTAAKKTPTAKKPPVKKK
ncbi:MAG: hypothetical protein ACJ77K_12495 [Bacteroidia bacterium]|jgi:hypothetical protein